MLVLVREIATHALSPVVCLSEQGSDQIGTPSRILFGFLQCTMLFLLDLFVSDQFGPCLDTIHGGRWRWSFDCILFQVGNARDRNCPEASSCESVPTLLWRAVGV